MKMKIQVFSKPEHVGQYGYDGSIYPSEFDGSAEHCAFIAESMDCIVGPCLLIFGDGRDILPFDWTFDDEGNRIAVLT